jgi:hypothetical protein
MDGGRVTIAAIGQMLEDINCERQSPRTTSAWVGTTRLYREKQGSARSELSFTVPMPPRRQQPRRSLTACEIDGIAGQSRTSKCPFVCAPSGHAMCFRRRPELDEVCIAAGHAMLAALLGAAATPSCPRVHGQMAAEFVTS